MQNVEEGPKEHSLKKVVTHHYVGAYVENEDSIYHNPWVWSIMTRQKKAIEARARKISNI